MTVETLPQEEESFVGYMRMRSSNRAWEQKQSLGCLGEEHGRFEASLGYPVKLSQEKPKSKGTSFKGRNTDSHFLHATGSGRAGLMRDCENLDFFFVVLHLVPMLFSPLLMSIKTSNPSKHLSFLQNGRHFEGFLATKSKNKPKQTSNGFL